MDRRRVGPHRPKPSRALLSADGRREKAAPERGCRLRARLRSDWTHTAARLTMMWFTELLRRLRYLLRREHYTAELEEEIRLHMELRDEQLRTSGLAPKATR